MLSSPHDSTFIVVFVYQDLREIPTGSPPAGLLKRGGVWKCRNFQPITCYISKVRHFSNFCCTFWPPEYAPATIAVNFTWMERGFKACKTPRSIYPSISNHFWDIAIYRWRVVKWMSVFLPHFVFPWLRPWDNRGKYHTVGKEIQCLSNAFQHVPIYLQPFLRYSELLVENCDIFRPHLCIVDPHGVTLLDFREDLDTHKTRMNGLSCAEESMTVCSCLLYTSPSPRD